MAYKIISAQAMLPTLVMLPDDERFFVESIKTDALLQAKYISARKEATEAYQRSFTGVELTKEQRTSLKAAFHESLRELRKKIVGRDGIPSDYIFG